MKPLPRLLSVTGVSFLLAATFAWLAPEETGQAQGTLIVTSTADSGAGTLRNAIAAAGAGTVITFNLPNPSTITLTSTELTIPANLTIQGPGADQLTISGANARRIFVVPNGVSLLVRKIKLANGRTTNGGYGGAIYNAGTLTLEDVHVADSLATGGTGIEGNRSNTAPGAGGGGGGGGGVGGALYNEGGTVAILRSAFTGNIVRGGTGGARNPNGSSGSGGGGGGFGGAIANVNGVVSVMNSTLSGNRAEGGSGGGTHNNFTGNANGGAGGPGYDGSIGTAGVGLDGALGGAAGNGGGGGGGNSSGNIGGDGGWGGGSGGAGQNGLRSGNGGFGGGAGGRSSRFNPGTGTPGFGGGTPSANTGAGGGSFGGAIFSRGGSVSITNSTIANNTAAGIGGGSGFGGGLFNMGAAITTTNTLLATNVASPASNGADAYNYAPSSGTMSSQGYNLIGCLEASGFVAAGGDLTSASCSSPLLPLIGPLLNNLGPTPTHALLDGSPAINAGSNSDAPLTDQRGDGFNRIVDDLIDIGAFESGNLLPPKIMTHPVGATVCPGTSFSMTVDAYGRDITYSWLKAGAPLSNITPFSGVATKTLTINPVSPTEGGTYSVVVSGPDGTVTSNGATLIVRVPVAITTHPANVSVAPGDGVGFSVAATGTAPLTYQWQLAPPNGSFANINGATGTSFSFGNVALAQNGERYRVIVTDACANSVTSNPATLSVAQLPQTISWTAVPDKIFGMARFKVTAAATSTLPITYSVASGPATINGNEVTLTGPGTVTLQADQVGNFRFLAAPPAQEVFEVAPQPAPVVRMVTTAADSGAGSLRQNVLDAITGDTIMFSSSLFGGTITLTSADIKILINLNIIGPGADLLAIHGNNANRIFDVVDATTFFNISGLTLTNAKSSDGRGGAIANAGTTTVSELTIQNSVAGGGTGVDGNRSNTAPGAGGGGGGGAGGGGAIYNAATGTLDVSRSALVNNTARGGDGGRRNPNGSSGSGGGGAGFGGAVTNNGGTVVIKNTTISANRAEGGNGGGTHDNFTGNANGGAGGAGFGTLGTAGIGLDGAVGGAAGNGGGGGGGNSSGDNGGNGGFGGGSGGAGQNANHPGNGGFGGGVGGKSGAFGVLSGTPGFGGAPASGTQGVASGGGAFGGAVFTNGGSVTLNGVTIFGNTAVPSSGASAYGGGLALHGGSITILNTIVAGNTLTNLANGVDGWIYGPASGTIATGGHNLIGCTEGGAFPVGATDITGSACASPLSPQLRALGNYGGPTPTHGLIPGSPALNAGDNAGASGLTDQRGAGFARIVGGTIDIGAYEDEDAGTTTITSQPTAVTACVATPASFSVVATGTGLSYQWRRNGVNLAASAKYVGALTPNLTVTNLVTGDAGSFDVVINGLLGLRTSDPAALTVTPLPSITTQPATQNGVYNGAALFTANASSFTSVQWQVSTDGGTNWSDVPGATATTLSLSSLQIAQNGYRYRAVFTNGCGTTPTNAAILNVAKANQTITFNQPAAQTYGNAPIPLPASSNSGLPVTITVVSGPGSWDGNLLTITGGSANIVVRASQPGDTNYNAATAVDRTITISKKALTVTTVAVSKVYGSNNPSFSVTYNGFVNNETPSVLGGTLAFSTSATQSSNVGTFGVTPSGLTSSNYAITFVAANLTVTPAPLTITTVNASKTYGALNPSFSVTYSGFVLNQTQTVLGGTLTFNTTATNTSVPGDYSVTPGGRTSTNYAITNVAGTLTINAAALTVTVNASSKVYGAANPAFTVSYSGFVLNQNATALGGALTFTTSATAASPVGPYQVTASGLTSTNYTISYVAGTLTVTKAALTVKTDNISKLYGEDNPAFTASYTGLVNGDTPSSLTGSLAFSTTATSSSGVGSYNVTPSGLTSPNYTITFAVGTLTINKAPLTVTANNASKIYGAANPAFSVSYSGFVLGQSPSVLGGTLTFTTGATTSSPLGTYAITPSGLTSGNYAITFTAGTLTVDTASLTVTVNASSKIYGAANPAFTVSYTGFVLGQNAGVLGGALTFTTSATPASPAGSYQVDASGLTSSNYAISYQPGTLTINAAAVTVKTDDAARIYGDANPAFTASYIGLVNGDTPASLDGAIAFTTSATQTSNAGNYAVTPSGLSSGNYTITFVNGTLTITAAPLTVTVNDSTKIYGQPNPAFSVTYNGFVVGDTETALGGAVSFTTAANDASAAGDYSVSASGLTSSNYAIGYQPGTLHVTPAALTIRTVDSSRLYGDPNPAFTVSFSGFVNGDDAGDLNGSATFATGATASSPIGDYSVRPGGLSSPNYSVTFEDGTLHVGKAALSVIADNASRTYGDSNPAFTGTITGIMNGDAVTASYSTSAMPGSDIGTYDIVPALAGATLDNYTIVTTNGTLTITVSPLSLTTVSTTRSYYDPNPPLTGVLSGVKNGDPISSSFTTTATATSPAGAYPIDASLLDPSNRLGNYSVSITGGTLTVTNPLPVLNAIAPTTAQKGSAGFTLNLTGNDFVPQSVVMWNGAAITITSISRTAIAATVPASALTSPTVAYVTVSSGGPGGGTTSPQAFVVTDTGAPVEGTDTEAINGTSTASTGGSGAGTPGSVSVTASGDGAVTVAKYDGNPSPTTPSFRSSGTYFDVFVAPGSTLTSMTVVNCNLNGGNLVFWYDGTRWVRASNQTYNATTGCVTLTITATSSPSLSDLAGTYFASAADLTAPTTTPVATPDNLWPNNGRLVPVTVTGRLVDDASGVLSAGYHVVDEYGEVQPSGTLTLAADGSYSFTVSLPAKRNGTDKDGRQFMVYVDAKDVFGRTSSTGVTVIVPHDQGK